MCDLRKGSMSDLPKQKTSACLTIDVATGAKLPGGTYYG